VGPTGQTQLSNRPKRFSRTERHSPLPLSHSGDTHGDHVARASTAVPWPSLATSGLAVAAKMTIAFRCISSLEKSSWGARSCPRVWSLDLLGFWLWWADELWWALALLHGSAHALLLAVVTLVTGRVALRSWSSVTLATATSTSTTPSTGAWLPLIK
jgi:hypothetical protein